MTGDLHIVYTPLAELRRMPSNPKQHSVEAIRGSVYRFGMNDPVTIDEATGFLCEGHGRLEAMDTARRAGTPPPKHVRVSDDGTDWLLPTVRGVSFDSIADLEEYLAVHNQLTIAGGWDERLLVDLVKRVQARANAPVPLTALGFERADLDDLLHRAGVDGTGGGAGPGKSKATVPLASQFIVPPFSVLDARQGYWQERKRQWLALGIKSELGRGGARTFGQDLMRGEHMLGTSTETK